MQKRTFIFLLSFLFLSFYGHCQTNGGTFPRFVEAENTLFRISENQAYRFGYLEVPENRDEPDRRIIRLPVFIFKSRRPNPKPDPVIYTVGGPGSSTLPSAPYMNYYQYLDDRDLILFEQRGTQYAQPSLDCPEWAEAVHLSRLPGWDETMTDSILEDAALRCRKKLIAQGADLDGYNTSESAADIADLAKVLGLDQYNLLTISYSTKIAQVLIRDHPEGIRSVVMDSPLPLEVQYDEESVENLIETLGELLSRCTTDPECNMRFPALKERFFSFLEKISADPIAVSVQNPESGKFETFSLKGKDLVSVFTSASTGDLPNLAMEIERILVGDMRSVQEMLSSRFEGPGRGTGMGMRLSVWCTEEFPFSDQDVIRQETSRYPAVRGLSPAVFSAGICGCWDVAPAPGSENQPITSNIPVLLISGEFDNETPAKWAADMQANLKNSHHLTFKGWGHTPTTYWGNPCAMAAANAFFNNPDIKPSPGCIGLLGKFRFNLGRK